MQLLHQHDNDLHLKLSKHPHPHMFISLNHQNFIYAVMSICEYDLLDDFICKLGFTGYKNPIKLQKKGAILLPTLYAN